MRSFLKNNAIVLLLYIAAIGTALFFITRYEKTDINIYINQYVGNAYADSFFYYITYFGDGLVAAFILLGIVIYNVRIGIYSIFSFLTASIVSNGLKYFFFDDVNRPHYVFQTMDKLKINYVEGVDMHIHNSFPSGHATQAFAIGMCLVFASNNQGYKLLFFFLALMTSLSRVYLSQHWLIDISAGSLIGISFSFIYYYAFIYHNKFERLNRSLKSFARS